MQTRQHIQKKAPSSSSSTPVPTRIFQQRPFKDEADPAAVPSQQQETPDLQTQLEKAARFGHNFGRVQFGDTPAVIQPKLAIGAPGDKYEQEADQMAAQVMSMAAPANQQSVQREMAPEEEKEKLQTQPLAACISPLVQREMAPKPEEEEEPLQAKPLAGSTIQREMAPKPEEEEEPLQPKPSLQRATEAGGNDTGSNLESRLSNSKGGGSSLPDDVRSFMEPRFGADFSGVRVHTGSEAVQMNKELGAQAFTHGNDIYYGAGKSPAISDLTAHELTHVVQQTGGVQTKLTLAQSAVQRKCSVCKEEDDQLMSEEASGARPTGVISPVANQILQSSEQQIDGDDNLEPLPEISGEGEEEKTVAFGKGSQFNLKLQGLTTAKFDGGHHQVKDLQTTPASGCKGCGPKTCVNATGTLEATYMVTTNVKLPKVPKFPKLSECQKQAAQEFIDNVLAPHEQQHVDAFNQYNGTTETPFDIIACQNRYKSTIQSMFKKEESARKAAAKAASKALDPFVAPIEGLDCQDS